MRQFQTIVLISLSFLSYTHPFVRIRGCSTQRQQCPCIRSTLPFANQQLHVSPISLAAKRRTRGEIYKDEDEEDFFEDVISRPQWESCESCNAKVLLPTKEPTAILHFIGGTGFGALPQLTYGTFLEHLSQMGSFIVVSTPPLSSIGELSTPLNHNRIAYEVSRSFRVAYRTIIEDEYSMELAQALPIIGIGHSMGSRIHCVINAQSKLRRIGFPREGNVLISFNNYYAARSIPFLYEVGMLSRNVLKSLFTGGEWLREELDKQLAEVVTLNEQEATRRSRTSRNKQTKVNDYFYDDDNDLFDDEFDFRRQPQELASIRERTDRGMEWFSSQLVTQLKEMETNNNPMFEFQPSPEELIKMVESGNYGVPNTLLVQFDRDDIDQSALLARALLKQQTPQNNSRKVGDEDNSDTKGTNSNSARPFNDGESKNDLDVKFAFLKGTHLTPIIRDPTSFSQPQPNRRRTKRQRDDINEDFDDDDIYKVNQELKDLISTITSYINMVILSSSDEK